MKIKYTTLTLLLVEYKLVGVCFIKVKYYAGRWELLKLNIMPVGVRSRKT